MASLPDDVASTLVRAVGAYIRAVPLAELPPKLKRFKSLDRPRALAPHKDALLAVLEDDRLTRARISEWMADGRPSLAKREREALSLAVDRPDGWAASLAGLSAEKGSTESKAGGPSRKPAADPGQALTRAKERTTKARDEARRARADADKAVRSAHKRVVELERALEAAQAETGRLRHELAQAEKRAATSERAAERAERRARSDRDGAQEKEKALRAELKAVRKELRLERDRSQRRSAPRKPPRRQPAADRPGEQQEERTAPRRLRRLRAPKGRLETDPETLDAWLGVDGVHLLVDGYNVTKAEGGFGEADLPTQRRRLIEGVARIARKKKVAATIVFDGSEVAPGTSRRPKAPVAVEYSRPDEIADDHLVARLEALDAAAVVVATNDRELQHRAASLGATVATSNQLLALVR